MTTDRQLLELLVDKVTGIEVKLVEHDKRFDAVDKRFECVDKRFEGLESDIGGMKQEISYIKASQKRMESKQEAIMEQTAGLLEFRTQIQADIKEVQENAKSLANIVGEHEVYIRNLQRKIV